MPIEAIQAMEKPLVELGAGVLDGLWALTQKLEENTPKMDGENNGRKTPIFLWDDFLGKTHYFRKHPYQIGGIPSMLLLICCLGCRPKTSSHSS